MRTEISVDVIGKLLRHCDPRWGPVAGRVLKSSTVKCSIDNLIRHPLDAALKIQLSHKDLKKIRLADRRSGYVV